MVDYLIIGSGLAGIAFSEMALQNQKTVLVIDADIESASKVAAGLYNPVILKRFTLAWNAAEQLQLLDAFYFELETKLNKKLRYEIPILRRFFSIEEQNNWFIASDKIGLSPFLATNLSNKKYIGIDSSYDYGLVNKTGYVDVALLIEEYKKYLSDSKGFLNEKFEYGQLQIHTDFIEYKNVTAKHIVFAEGFGMHANPFFNDLPLDGAKGELLVIKAPQLDLDVIINTSIFILPIGNDLFKVGATYNWDDKTNLPTEKGKQELIDKLKEILTCDFEVVQHFAGVRPTVKDRKPLVGKHPEHSQLYILNGLGTRGVMLAPSLSKSLFEHIETGTALPTEIDIKRIYKKQ